MVGRRAAARGLEQKCKELVVATSGTTAGEAHRIRRRAFDGIRLTEGTHPAGSVIPWHTHDGPTICLVLRGAFVEYSTGVALDCRPSSLKFTPAGQRHWNRFQAAEVRGLLIEIDPARATALQRFEAALARSLQLRGGPELTLARRLYSEFRTMDSAAELAIEGLLLEMLALVARSRGPEARDLPAWVRRAHELVAARLPGQASLAAVAAEVGVHPATLARGFRRAYGCSLGEMQRRIRLDFAATQLVATTRPLADIAQEAGFFDQSHFTNAFRRALGSSPLRYRKAMREA
jgi:AraC family transcriptional regulator